MRYVPTIDLWAPGIITALHDGQLHLQPGQWVRCGKSSPPSRFAGVTPRTVVATHPQGKRGVPPSLFRAHRDYAISIGSR
jgi:hypothetical protein